MIGQALNMSAERGKQIEYVLRQVEDRDVRFVRLWFTDVLGLLKSVAITQAELEPALNGGIGFDGSTIEGPARLIENDMVAVPDPATFQSLPWRGETTGAARMFCDILTPSGEHSLADGRYVLKMALQKAKEKGLSFFAHPENEFYLFKDTDGSGARAHELKPIDFGGYFEHVPRSIGQDFRRDVITTLEKMGISTEFSHHEAGPGQQEIDLRYDDALTTADNIITFRAVVKEKALEHGMFASFMPKPMDGYPGSAMHTHFSLFDGDNNIFYDPNSLKYGLSHTGSQFIAGILDHAAEITAITNQYVNSYKRLSAGGEAPSAICWGAQNRSALIRVPRHKPGKGNSTRIEVRSLDSSANPYLSFAVILAAGLDGIDRKLELPEETFDDVWRLTDLERKAAGIEKLPASLGEALRIMQQSEFVADTLGETLYQNFLANKEDEWRRFRESVSQFEIDYLFSRV